MHDEQSRLVLIPSLWLYSLHKSNCQKRKPCRNSGNSMCTINVRVLACVWPLWIQQVLYYSRTNRAGALPSLPMQYTDIIRTCMRVHCGRKTKKERQKQLCSTHKNSQLFTSLCSYHSLVIFLAHEKQSVRAPCLQMLQCLPSWVCSMFLNNGFLLHISKQWTWLESRVASAVASKDLWGSCTAFKTWMLLVAIQGLPFFRKVECCPQSSEFVGKVEKNRAIKWRGKKYNLETSWLSTSATSLISD